MARVNFRIGTKLGLTAGVGVLLVAGMLINQMQSNQSIAQSSRLVVVNTSNKANAQTAEAAIARAQLASLEVSIALTPERLNQSHETMRASLAEASVEIDAAEQRATRQQVKDLYREIKKFIEVLQAAGNDLAAARKADLAGIQVRNQTSEAWTKTFDPLLALPSLAASSNHFNIDLNLREAGGALNAARAASWRYATTAEHAQRDLILSNSDLVIAALTRARLLASEKDVVAGIDGLLVIADRFKVVSRDSVKAEETNMRVLNESVIPAGKEVSARIVKVVAIANEFSARRQSELVAELDWVGKVAIGVGGLVVLMLLGSALFSVMNIARPIRRIGDVLLELANGNKTVDVPYATRGDEVGDAARAAKTFKENLIRMEQMEAEQKDEEIAIAARRRADMIKLADAFQAAVGGIVNTVSTASGELEAAAGTLSGTADETQQLSGMVASASEEASANVESVASAAEEMSTSVAEISRRVHDSSRIAGEAVLQAERTDARINELSEAADRIGHVVRLITAIAEQTNLLALNATIEAARAGASGRGFAVVAIEVKALAAQTAKATDEISVQITGMQAATRESVGAIKEISSTISRIAEIASTIAATVEEQGAATAEIARNVNEAARGTAQVAEKITQVNRGANATGTASAQVLASARSLSKESGSLKTEVENFLQTVRAA